VSPLGRYLIETAVTLLGVIALAVIILYGARRFGMGKPAGPLTLVGKLPLDGRRAIYLVRVGRTVFIIGASEGGLTKLGEVPEDRIDFPVEEPMKGPFANVLAQVLSRAKASPPSSSAEEPKKEEKKEEETT
jgi:flagellar protein FliO/FliZ